MIENKDIDYVLAIYRNGSISAAADELFITQPALTKYLQNLESRLGITLFERTKKSIAPTYAGERYITYASQIASIKETLEQEIELLRYTDSRTLKVGFSGTGVRRYVSKAASALLAEDPHLSIMLEERTSKEIEQQVINRSLNLGFIALTPNRSNDISANLLFEEAVLLAVPADSPLIPLAVSIKGARYPWISLDNFKNELFILRNPGPQFRDLTDRLFEQYQFSPKVLMTTRSQHSAIEYAETFHCCTFTTESFISNLKDPKSMRFFLVGSPMEKISIGYITRKDTPMHPLAKKLITEFYHQMNLGGSSL